MASGISPGSLILVDAHALVYQFFHAIPAMSAPDGRPTNAIFGFTRDLMYMRDELKPAYLLCAFDRPEPTFRSDLYPDYKAHRQPPPDDLCAQIEPIHQVIEAMNLPVLTAHRYEADDVMATVAVAGRDRGLDVFLCTTDKDCRQLIDNRVRIYNLRKRLIYDREALLADWGVKPEQVVDFQTLVGDSVDNVPGVPGVGPKTAAKFLQEYGTLDNLLANIDKLKKGKTVDNLRAFAEKAELSRKLVRLETKVPMNLDWDGWTVRDWDCPRLLKLFEGFGFRGFAARARSEMKKAGGDTTEELFSRDAERSETATAVTAPRRRRAPQDLFADAHGDETSTAVAEQDFPFGANAPLLPECKTETDWQVTYELVNTPEKFDDFLKKLKKQKRFAFDLETTDLDPLRADLVGLAFSWKEAEAYYLPVCGPEGDKCLNVKTTLEALKPIFENPKVAKVNQNIKYDGLALGHHGVKLTGVAGDPMVADYLLRSGERTHNLDELARRYLNHENIPITDLIGKKGKAQIGMAEVSTEKVCKYSCEDVEVAWRLCGLLEPQLKEQGLKKLYDDVEVPLIGVLMDLESTGVRLDVPFLGRLSEDMARQLQVMEKEIHDLAGHPFNIASPKQLRTVLFDELKLPAQKRTATAGEASTDQETLERLAALHPLPRKIIEHRQIAKLKGTYVDALPALINPNTCRVHTSFNQTVAATGRLSSSDPNLQNIPARTDLGRQIRQAFVPREGWRLVTADYSQVELRLLAHFSGDANLTRAFAEGRDIHETVAAQIFKVEPEHVTAAQRRVAKTVNFGVIYGMSAHGLAIRLSISQKDAAEFIEGYFARFPAVQKYQSRLLADCFKKGYVGTLLGRRRAIQGVRERTSVTGGLNQPEREAVNMEIQGSAADLMKLAMLAVHRRLESEKFETRMLLTVHDELVFESPPGEVKRLADMVREEMTTAMKLKVPLVVDVAAGPNWLDVEEVAA
jgi:DNA polymerase-1